MKTPPRLPSPTSKSRDWSKVNQSETTGTNMECEDHLPETSSGSDEYQFLSDLHSPKPMHNPIPNAEMGSFKSNGLHASSKGITFCHYMIAVCSSSLLNRFNISPKFSQLDSHYGHEMVNMWAGLKGGVWNTMRSSDQHFLFVIWCFKICKTQLYFCITTGELAEKVPLLKESKTNSTFDYRGDCLSPEHPRNFQLAPVMEKGRAVYYCHLCSFYST